jgi:amidase
MSDLDDDAFVCRFDLPGAAEGPLAGTRFAIKDVYDVKGYVTGAGNPDWARTHEPAPTHASVLGRLLAAGAHCVGKTHTDEIAYSLMGVNVHYGTPRNPAAPERVPGGSSSGSASAVAAGTVDFALGTDTGGSVRLPASFCGIIGIRTTHGRIPVDGLVPLSPSFDTVGWFARDIATMRRVADALEITGADTNTSSVKLLMPRDLWNLAAPEVQTALERAQQALIDAFGAADETPIDPAGLETWRETFRICQAAEVWAAHGAWVEVVKPAFGDDVQARFTMASRITVEEANAARANRAEIADRLNNRLGADGLIAIPTAPAPAPRRSDGPDELDTFRSRALALLCPAGLAGLPQVSLAVATVDGAPVGLSLVGPRNSDRLLLDLAAYLS